MVFLHTRSPPRRLPVCANRCGFGAVFPALPNQRAGLEMVMAAAGAEDERETEIGGLWKLRRSAAKGVGIRLCSRMDGEKSARFSYVYTFDVASDIRTPMVTAVSAVWWSGRTGRFSKTSLIIFVDHC